MNNTTGQTPGITTTSGAADLPEALRRSTAADGKTELFNLPGYPLMVRAVDFNRIHTESEMRRTALLDEMQKAALAAGQATAAQPGVVYAELPVPNYPKSGGFPGTFAEAQMHAFADATHAIRASRGQAPAETGNSVSAQTDSVQEDAACWHWLAEYLVGTRTDLDDEIVASETVNDLRKLVKAAIKQGEKQ